MASKTLHVVSLLLIASGHKNNYFNCGQEVYENIYFQFFPNLFELDQDLERLKHLFSALNFEIKDMAILAAYFLSLSGKINFLNIILHFNYKF